jgi:hypothetical protein
MKTKLVLSTMGLIILIASMFVLYSCSKVARESLTKVQKEQQDKNTDTTLVDDKDFTETDEDLMTVDYKEFYDELAPYGEWVQVNPEDVGLKSKIASSNSSGNNSFSISNLLGVKDAYADASMGMIFVWKPSPDLTIAGSVGETHEYMPYSNGQWINTDEGWYFRGRTPYEETVSHHGRWVHSKHGGWMWVPGRVWAPAWVDWRQNDDYVSWAPLSPSIYFSAGNMNMYPIDDDDYVIVERRHFCDPEIYRYYNPYYEDGSRVSINLMIGTVGLVVVNNTIINRGPDVNIIQNFYGRNIDLVNLHHVRNYNDVRYSEREYNVYSPGFKRYKNKENNENKNFVRNEPKSFKNYDEVKQRKSEDNNYNKEDKQNKKENIINDNGNKQKSNDNGYKKNNENVKKQKSQDNSNKQKSNDNVKKQKSQDNSNKQKSNNNVKKQKSQDNSNNQKSNDNVKKQKSQDNSNKQKSNDNVKKQKSQDNGNKQKSPDNGNKQKSNENRKGKK